MLDVRLLEPRDADDVLALLETADTEAFRPLEDDLRRRDRGSAKYHVLVAWLDVEAVGVLEGTVKSDFRGQGIPRDRRHWHSYISALYVRPDHQLQGWGRALIDAQTALAAGAGCTFLAIAPDHNDDDTDRIDFFEAVGFRWFYDNLWGMPIAAPPSRFAKLI